MALDMKDPEVAKRFSELFVKKKSELSPLNMSPDQLLEHIQNLESGLEILIFESRAEIQGARDFLEETLKKEKEEVRKQIREKDKQVKYRPSLLEQEKEQREAKRKAAANSKSNQISDLMAKYKTDKKKADMILGFMKLGMSEEAAAKMAGC